MSETGAGQSPWWLSQRDRVILLVLCALIVGLAAYRVLAPRLTAGRGVGKLAPGARREYLVDVNSADEGELDLLPGIGPARAKALVKFRREHGGFASLDDLAKVPGISLSTASKLDGLVRFGPATPGGDSPH